MIIPFTTESIEQDMSNCTMVISRNVKGKNTFVTEAHVQLMDFGEAVGAEGWTVDNGALRIDMGHNGGFYEFRGIESINGAVYAVGTHSCRLGGPDRVTMHKGKSLTDAFGVCISSHVNYEKEALPVALKSLRKAGVDNSKVMVVVGGCREEEDGNEEDLDGIRLVRRRLSAMGFTALGEAVNDESPKYWVLLHDTCVVDKDFEDKASGIDVGMNPDVVLFSGLSEGLEIGLYSSEYLSKGIVEIDGRPEGMLKRIVDNASVVIDGVSMTSSEPERDVYGSGIMRKVLTMGSFGVRKNTRRGRGKKRP